MKDRSDDPSHHERTLLPRSYISLPIYIYILYENERKRKIHPFCDIRCSAVYCLLFKVNININIIVANMTQPDDKCLIFHYDSIWPQSRLQYLIRPMQTINLIYRDRYDKKKIVQYRKSKGVYIHVRICVCVCVCVVYVCVCCVIEIYI